MTHGGTGGKWGASTGMVSSERGDIHWALLLHNAQVGTGTFTWLKPGWAPTLRTQVVPREEREHPGRVGEGG